MGYTHYFGFKGNAIPPYAFDNIVKDVKKIEEYFKYNTVYSKNAGGYYKEHPVTLHDGWGKRKGILYRIEEIGGKQKIVEFSLNGNDKGDLGHESFYLMRGKDSEQHGFCKTARKPYDLAVCMILLSVQYHLNTAKIASDGKMDEWKHAIRLWKQLFKDRFVEVAGLTKEYRNLYVVRLGQRPKRMKLKKELI